MSGHADGEIALESNRSTITLVVILASLLLMGFWVYHAPEHGVRPTFAKGTGSELSQIDARNRVEAIGYVQAVQVKEASGLCKSRKHAGVYWTLCDSGNLPFLFAIEANGKLRATVRVQEVQNVDWEAIAMDEQGRLYIGDIGNNFQKLNRRSIYRIEEPDSLEDVPAQEPRTVTVTGRWHFTYPGKPFDAESLLAHEGSFWIISKAKHLGGTRLYRLGMQDEGLTQPLEQVGMLAEELSQIADASLSPDGKQVALVNRYYAAVLPLGNGKISDLCKSVPTFYEFDLFKVEGCAWEGDTLILIEERRKVYRLPVKSLEK